MFAYFLDDILYYAIRLNPIYA